MSGESGETVLMPISNTSFIFGDQGYVVSELSHSQLVKMRLILMSIFVGSTADEQADILMDRIKKLEDTSERVGFDELQTKIADFISRWWLVSMNQTKRREPLSGSDNFTSKNKGDMVTLKVDADDDYDKDDAMGRSLIKLLQLSN